MLASSTSLKLLVRGPKFLSMSLETYRTKIYFSGKDISFSNFRLCFLTELTNKLKNIKSYNIKKLQLTHVKHYNYGKHFIYIHHSGSLCAVRKHRHLMNEFMIYISSCFQFY